MASVKTSKQKLKSAWAANFQPLVILELAAIALLLVVLFFYLVILRLEHGDSGYLEILGASNSHIVENLNYHGYQAPEDFPRAMLAGKVGNFTSSQEYSLAGQNKLKYVSFMSSLPTAELFAFYKSYLEGRAFESSSIQESGQTTLAAVRGRMKFDVILQPNHKGSSVAIYYSY